MLSLDTLHPTQVFSDYLIDPSIMDNVFEDTNEKRKVIFYSSSDSPTLNVGLYLNFIRDISSDFLTMNGYKHKRDEWYMDVIRYKLDKDVKRVKSGLAWHCENDNYPNVITVLLYLRIDDDIIDGNLRYKDRDGTKKLIEIKSGTTIIMDGNVPHKPQDPYGTGIRDLIIMSFVKD
tara:strand:- start:508 stop:1035 length:528 start_codon:yes stop_codon:yes gene_type:complete